MFRKFILAVVGCLLLGIVGVSAREDVDSITNIGTGHGLVSAICKNANEVAGTNILSYTSADGILSFSNKKYSSLDIDTKKRFMESALSLTKSSGLGNQVKNKVYNFIADQDSTTSAAIRYLSTDASADFSEGASWFKPFGSAFGVFLGFMSLLIFVCLATSIVLDIAFIGVPMMRIFFQGVSKKEKPKFITNEAYSTLMECEGSSTYKNNISLYLSRRVPVLLGITLCLGYLISGKIYDIIAFFIDAFTNF